MDFATVIDQILSDIENWLSHDINQIQKAEHRNARRKLVHIDKAIERGISLDTDARNATYIGSKHAISL
ncbi:hypothetical protein ACLUUI_00605 [Enterobacterales bacterium AW_CKDN230030176-1A_HGKHYDSX7]